MCTTTLWSRSVIGLLLLLMVSALAPAVTIAQQTAPTSEGVLVNTIEDLVGIWESQHGVSGAKTYRQYEADGTIREAYSLDNLQTSPLHTGHVWFENNVYCEKSDHPLAPDSPGKYEARIHKAEGMPDRLSFRMIDDVDKYRVKDFAAGMTRMEPSGKIVNTAEELVGIWETRFLGMKAYSQYEADGTIRLAYARENLQTSPVHTSHFWFEGNVYFCEGDSMLTKGLPGKYEVRLHTEAGKPDRLSFHVIDDANTYRVKDLTPGMTRAEISPPETGQPNRLFFHVIKAASI